jgi:hypothetical protein
MEDIKVMSAERSNDRITETGLMEMTKSWVMETEMRREKVR